jgi:hypothetical protein
MSWLAHCIIEGFAAYGHAVHPTFTDMDGLEDSKKRQWHEAVQCRDEFALPRDNPWQQEEPRKLAERETRTMVPARETRDD